MVAQHGSYLVPAEDHMRRSDSANPNRVGAVAAPGLQPLSWRPCSMQLQLELLRQAGVPFPISQSSAKHRRIQWLLNP